MRSFVDHLAQLCRDYPTTAKWVIVPTHALGHTLGDRLALDGTDWVNLRFKTPFDLALETAAPILVDRDIDPVAEDVCATLVMRLLLELPATVPSYFRDLAGQPVQEKMAAALWSTLRELRMAGLTSGDLPASAFATADKHAEIVALVAAYESYLSSQRLADTAAVFNEALSHLEECPIGAEDIRMALPNVIWPPLVRRFVDALPGSQPRVIDDRVDVIPGLTQPSRLTGRALSKSDRPARTSSSSRAAAKPENGPDAALPDATALRFLMQPEGAPSPNDDGSLVMFRAGGREAEIEEVFRRIFVSDLPFDAFEIACASADYPFLVWQKALRYGWPLTVSTGVPVTATRPARALLSLLDWVEHDYPASRLRRLLQSGDVTIDREDGPTAGQAARLLARSEAAWGRTTYGHALKALAASERDRADDLETDEEAQARSVRRADHADGLRLWIDHLLALVPEPDADGLLQFERLVSGVRIYVADLTRKTSHLDAAAAMAIGVALDELRLLGDLRRPMSEVLRLLRGALEDVTVGADRARPAHLYVTTLTRAGHAGRAHTFVVGLEEGRVFPAHVEDAVLLDSERTAISGELPTSGDRATEAVFAIVSRLAELGIACHSPAPRLRAERFGEARRSSLSTHPQRAKAADPQPPAPDPEFPKLGSQSLPARSVCLSYSCRDLRQYRDTFPSWLLLQVHRLGRSGQTTYQDLIDTLGEPMSSVPRSPDAALSDSGWWLAHLHTESGLTVSPLLRAFPWLRRGRSAEDARASERFTSYDGHVPAAGPVLDPRTSGRVVSVTRLEQLAGCPFRHFLQYGLGVDAIEEQEPDRDVWLDPLIRGSELHALYADIMRKIRAEQRAVDLVSDHRWLVGRADARLKQLRGIMPPPSDIVFDRERQRLIDDLDLFLRFEAERTDRTPVAFEVGFGRPGRDLLTDAADAVEPLARAEPVRIGDDRSSFLLRGRIDRIDRIDRLDRIDRIEDHTYEVVDYKTGRFFRDDYDGTFRGGRLLQHAVYGLAAVQLLRTVDPEAGVAAGTYYFPSARGGGQVSRKPHPASSETMDVLTDLFDTVAAGGFVHTDQESDCKWCEYDSACGRSHTARAKRKIWNPENDALDPFRRLRQRE